MSKYFQRKHNSLIHAALLAVTLFTGCATSPPSEQRPSEPVVIDLPPEKAMRAAESVLGEMHFTLRHMDLPHGRILTHPLSGAQCFEFWRRDAVGAFNRIESTLHTVRRTAELHFTPVNGGTQIDCTVHTERLNLPSRQTAGPNQAYQLLTESTPIVQTLKLSPDQQRAMHWVPLGPDTQLAHTILKKIAEHQQKTQRQRLMEVASYRQKRNRNQ